MNARSLLIVGLLVAVPACGDSTTDTSSAPTKTTTTVAASSAASTTTDAPDSSASADATVTLVDSPYGKILADGNGVTLYLFTKDSGTVSACSGGCLAAWPPVVASGTPTPGTGLDAEDLGSITREDGSKQVTFYGHPVYTYGGDSGPGEFTGQGSGGSWFVIGADGNPVKAETGAASGAGSTTVKSDKGY